MKPRRLITPQDATLLFDEAVRERALAVITAQSGDTWRTLKCRFLERDPQRRFFVLDHQPPHGSALPELQPGHCVGVSFRAGNRKILFASVIEARGHYLFDDRTSIPAIRYRWPDSLTELQRRSYYRTPVPETLTLRATVWPGAAHTRPTASSDASGVLSGTLADLSCGGALLRVTQPLPAWSDEEPLGVELHLADGRPPLLTSALFRGVRQDELGRTGAAIQFVGLELSVDGRLALQRVAACVQRFHRLSLGSELRGWNKRDSEFG